MQILTKTQGTANSWWGKRYSPLTTGTSIICDVYNKHDLEITSLVINTKPILWLCIAPLNASKGSLNNYKVHQDRFVEVLQILVQQIKWALNDSLGVKFVILGYFFH